MNQEHIKAVQSSVGDLKAAAASIGQAATALRELQKENAELRKEVAHWKANHADLKERLHVATSRTDLPSDRLPLFDQMRKQIAELQEALDNLAPYDEETGKPESVESFVDTVTNSDIEDKPLVRKLLKKVSELERLNDAVGHTPTRHEIDSHIVDIQKILRR